MVLKYKDKLVIGISGKKGSGKDTVAKYIRDNSDESFLIWYLAEPVKSITMEAFNLTREQVYDQELKELPIREGDTRTPRELLQFVGTDCFRAKYPNIWVDNMVNRIKNHLEPSLILIPDIRFENEVDLCDYVIRVEREDSVSTDTHKSETALDNYPFTYIIKSKTGDFDSLHKQTKAICLEIKDKLLKELGEEENV